LELLGGLLELGGLLVPDDGRVGRGVPPPPGDTVEPGRVGL